MDEEEDSNTLLPEAAGRSKSASSALSSSSSSSSSAAVAAASALSSRNKKKHTGNPNAYRARLATDSLNFVRSHHASSMESELVLGLRARLAEKRRKDRAPFLQVDEFGEEITKPRIWTRPLPSFLFNLLLGAITACFGFVLDEGESQLLRLRDLVTVQSGLPVAVQYFLSVLYSTTLILLSVAVTLKISEIASGSGIPVSSVEEFRI